MSKETKLLKKENLPHLRKVYESIERMLDRASLSEYLLTSDLMQLVSANKIIKEVIESLEEAKDEQKDFD